MSNESWLQPLVTALIGLAGGGGLVSWMQRGKTAADANLSQAEAEHKHAEAESVTVQTIQSALATVQRLSEAKDKQIADVRQEMADQNAKHLEVARDLQSQVTALTEQLSLVARALSAHGQWDLYVLAHVRQTMPSFPDPPPLGFVLDTGGAPSDSPSGAPSGGQAT